MFEWVPFLHGKYFTYNEYLFLLTFSGFSAISIISFLLGKYLNRKKRLGLSFLSLKSRAKDTSDDYFDAKTETSSVISESFYSENESLVSRTPKLGTTAGNAALWVSWFFLSLIPGVFATFSIFLPMWLAALMVLCINMIRIRYKLKADKAHLYTTLEQSDKIESYEVQSKPLISFYKRLTVFFVSMSIILPLIFNKICVSAYQDYVGPIFGTASISTQFTRFFQLSKGCPPGPPCHIYATLPEDGATSVFINAHTDESYEIIRIFYDTDETYQKTESLNNYVDSVSFEVEGTDYNGKRRVHSFYLNNLQPDTKYFFHIVYDNKVQAQNYYQTLPDETNPRDLVILQGGDMGDTLASRLTTLAASRANPDVIILGGDIAYDNGMCSCYFAWDFLFRDLNEITIQNGRLIPLILAVGNHDVGLDSITGKKLTLGRDSPFYMTFFPQQSKVDADGDLVPEVPTLEERTSYHYHKFGKVLIMNMDSGYLEDVGNKQTMWMRETLDKYPSLLKFANYHCPMYFACKGGDASSIDIVEAQKEEWLPIFDEYKFAVAFENHEHHMKRTFPLKNNTRNDQGTLYIGNGQWGTIDSGTCESYNQTGIYESVQNIYHFWLVNVSFSQGTIKNTAYDRNNTAILDVMSQNIGDFLLEY